MISSIDINTFPMCMLLLFSPFRFHHFHPSFHHHHYIVTTTRLSPLLLWSPSAIFITTAIIFFNILHNTPNTTETSIKHHLLTTNVTKVTNTRAIRVSQFLQQQYSIFLLHKILKARNLKLWGFSPFQNPMELWTKILHTFACVRIKSSIDM